MLPEIFNNFKYILASQSPRRQHLLRELGFDFTVDVRETEEDYPLHLKKEEIALYISEQKADAFTNKELEPTATLPGKILITADTIVCHKGIVLGKPANADDAFDILSRLSGSMHEVYTGIYLKSSEQRHSFFDMSQVYFKHLTSEEIQFYIEHCKPYDKAGAYGVQEWIGYVAVEKIVGSFYNVMGFPTHLFYQELKNFILNHNNDSTTHTGN